MPNIHCMLLLIMYTYLRNLIKRASKLSQFWVLGGVLHPWTYHFNSSINKLARLIFASRQAEHLKCQIIQKCRLPSLGRMMNEASCHPPVMDLCRAGAGAGPQSREDCNVTTARPRPGYRLVIAIKNKFFIFWFILTDGSQHWQQRVRVTSTDRRLAPSLLIQPEH